MIAWPCHARRTLAVLAALAVLPVAVVAAPAPARAAAPPAPSTTLPVPPPATAELLADLDTGRVLLASNVHRRLPPASLTKMLTAMIAVARIPADAVIPVSARAANVTPDRVGLKAGQRWGFGIVLHALLISSANDAAYALAERISGSVERFAGVMQLAASELGMVDHPQLRDPAGLDGTEGVDGGNLLSTWDVAVAARDLLANPTLAGIVRLTHYRFIGPHNIVYDLANHNRAFLESYPGAIGVKTGFTDPAGVCVAEAAERGGRALLAVVMNGVSPDRTAELLLDRGFAIPIAAERHDPTLPAVRQPVPRPPAPSSTTLPTGARRFGMTGPGSSEAAGGPTPGRTRPGTDQTPVMLSSAAAVGLVAVVTALVAAWALRRRRRSGSVRGARPASPR
jgi:D-alanyl-D-alanine carboxypeptidase